jgi:HSP20 family protein
MATDTRHKNEPSRADTAQRSQRPTNGPQHDRDWERASLSPFSIMRQGIDEMERLAGQIGRGWGAGGWPSASGLFSHLSRQGGDWSPAIDAYQRGNEFVIRAEVPGLTRQDLTVEVGDDAVTIHGERKREFDEDRDGVVWSERSFGSFTRVVPLPPGAIGDSAKATFANGILEIVMQTPSPEARRGRRIDISGGGEK